MPRERPVRGLLIDAGGTLLSPREPVAALYAAVAARHGHRCREDVVAARFREAFRRARPVGQARYVGDGRPYWRGIVSFAVGVDNPALFEELYRLYAEPQTWVVAPGAMDAIRALRGNGVAVGIASNWDNRLRPLLAALGVEVDALAISSELAVEKPDSRFFHSATEMLGVHPSAVAHLGDDPIDDVDGARTAGLTGWLWGRDVRSMAELPARLGIGDPSGAGRTALEGPG